jgi:type III restriction enzyme
MEFKFDGSEEYQLAAIEAVTALFEGQGYIRSQLVIPKGASFQVIANRLDLMDDTILANLAKVQGEQGLPADGGLQKLTAEIDTFAGKAEVRFPNFSVEMETGTGKTYVYLRTAHRLFQQYGLRKFIVVVPSVAVREGVKKTLDVTKKHLDNLYGKPPYRYSVYESANLSQIRTFALSDGLEIMVTTIDAFKRSETVLRQSREGQEPPICWLQATRPVLILDEPQNMESELSVAALAALNPLFALRYSATHRNPYNVVYRLTPYDAYRQGLVKRIEVASVIQEDNANLPFIRLDEITTKKRTLTARVAVHKLMQSGKIIETVITVRSEDDLAEKTGRPEYQGFVVEEINFGSGYVRFANNVEIRRGETKGAVKEAIFEAQIKFTIEEHFRKQARYRERGIKVLSLFFIDRVENFANDDGVIRKLFMKAFDEAKQHFPDWKDRSALEVQASYFASKTRKGSAIEFLDTSGKTKEDEAAFNLIMREKEKLLSFEEPVSFIFSHSALREGWDNPNVFQICAMREVGSETERRQQVGRGIRLPVSQAGGRIRDEQVNVLTVVASETYERFVAGLQSEIEREYGKEGVPPPPPNAHRKGTIKLRKHFMLKPEFKELWERIRPKTRYAVTVDTDRLIDSVVPELDEANIRKPRITIAKAEMRAGAAEDIFEAIMQSGARTAVDLAGRYPLPNLIEIMENLMENTPPPMRLSRKTLLSIYRRTRNRHAALDNPHEFAVAAVNIIKAKLADQLVDGIKYIKDGTWYEETLFRDEIENIWLDYLVRSEAVSGVGGTHLYDGAIFESEGVEKPFIHELEKRADVKLYVKLPDWFQVDTPIGRYNPDWAIVMENPEDGDPVLYLTREPKASSSSTS